MSFATVKENQSSNKFHLIRIEPARFVNDLLVNNSGIYEMTFPFEAISKVQANGVDLIYTTGAPTAGQYSYNESTKLLRINSVPSSTNALVVFYYIFLTGDKFIVFNQNPDDSNTSLREWQPRLRNFPRFSQSISNIIGGRLSINSSSIDIIQNERDFMNYLTDNDSFYQKEVKAWLCLDSVSNRQKVFNGKVTGIKVNRNIMSLTVDDNFGVLDQPCLLNDGSLDAYFNKIDFPNLEPNKNNFPRRFIFGTVSKYTTINTPVGSFPQAQSIKADSLNEAVCTNYSETISTSNNRQFGICRSKDGFLDFGFTPSSVDNTGANHTELFGTNAQISKFKIGDTFRLYDGVTNYYERVLYVDLVANKLVITKNASLTTSFSVITNKCPSIVILNDNIQYYPLAERDYSISETTTVGGNKKIDITFTNNFESTLSMPDLNPTSMKIGYRVKPDQANINHADIVKFILQSVGLSVNASSFSTAKTDFAVNGNFSVPYYDETDYGSVYKYIENILESSLSYLSLDNNLDMKYSMLSVPISTNEITNTEILRDSFSISINYKDISNQVVSYNPHYASVEAIGSSASSDKSNKSRWLHGVNKVTIFRHVLENMTSKILDHIAIKSEREATYTFDTKTKNLDNILGDDVLLKIDSLLGGESQRVVKIMGIDKSNDQSQITANDLFI